MRKEGGNVEQKCSGLVFGPYIVLLHPSYPAAARKPRIAGHVPKEREVKSCFRMSGWGQADKKMP